ncbi:unnamed protein product [Strongylus vulgaris]|uniref:Uncharacterized protein n=1 Tax=Strongylus vulgaris TaxID=40348 RepID=A0A3P7IB30_STRVU|nr:unnamed protein product [Strongylus vulgaris]
MFLTIIFILFSHQDLQMAYTNRYLRCFQRFSTWYQVYRCPCKRPEAADV